MPKTAFVLAALFTATVASAQQAANETDLMRSNGKIYVVMAVVMTIVAGLFAYVANLDRKISRLEKKG